MSRPDPELSGRSLTLLRLAVAALLGVHAWVRVLPIDDEWLGGVIGFGGWFSAQGLPAGVVISGALTLVELVGSACLAANRLVLPACLAHAAILLAGIVMVHGDEGWFVVGRGRNGAEYSALLLICLLAIALPRLRRRR